MRRRLSPALLTGSLTGSLNLSPSQTQEAGGRRKSVYGPTRREVVRRLREARWLLAQGLSVSARKMSVGLLLTIWLELTRERIRPSTYESYELNVRRLAECLGELPLRQ